ncbi:hypothetical protein N2W54_006669 [Lotmaria passim]
MLRACGWDHATLPYTPPTPCVLFYLVPGDPVWRVSVPNARGEYPNLVPGLPYREWYDMDPCFVQEYAPPALTVEAAAQVSWEELPVPPPPHLQHFIEPSGPRRQSGCDGVS